ncbi:hypothetical protein BH09BAC3_BH09BAC3_25390 [soil metagenome]
MLFVIWLDNPLNFQIYRKATGQEHLHTLGFHKKCLKIEACSLLPKIY